MYGPGIRNLDDEFIIRNIHAAADMVTKIDQFFNNRPQEDLRAGLLVLNWIRSGRTTVFSPLSALTATALILPCLPRSTSQHRG